MRVFWSALALSAVLLGACSGNETSLASSPGSTADASPPDVTAASIGAFSDELTQSPAWGSVRRGGPPDLQSVVEGRSGAVNGRLIGISLADPVPISASDLIGQDVEIRPGTEDGEVLEGSAVTPTLSLQSIVLEVSVESTSGDLRRDPETVGVPVVVWTSADAGDTQQELLNSLLGRLKALAPIGADVLVMVADLEAGKDQDRVVTPGHTFFGSLASVVFETSDAGLVSLDPLIGDSAEDYFGSPSLAEIRDSLA